MRPVLTLVLITTLCLLLPERTVAAGWSGALTQEPRTWGRRLASPPTVYRPTPRPIYPHTTPRPHHPDFRPPHTAPRPPARVIGPPKPVWPLAPPARRKTLRPPQSMPAPPNFE
jgi:hypothetical protein